MHKGPHAKLSLRPVHLPHFPSRKEQTFVTLLKARKPCVLFLQLQIQQHRVPTPSSPRWLLPLPVPLQWTRSCLNDGHGVDMWMKSPPPYIFIYLFTTPLPIPWLFYFQRIWFLHTPTGGANPAVCTSTRPLQQQPGLMWSRLSDSTGEGCALIGSFYGPAILGLTWLYSKSWHGTNAQGLPKSQEPLKRG